MSVQLESKPGVSELIKNATNQYQSAVETLNKNLPVDLTPQKLAEKFQETQKTITSNANELWKKAQGNTDLENEIKGFTKKQLDALTEQFQSYQVCTEQIKGRACFILLNTFILYIYCYTLKDKQIITGFISFFFSEKVGRIK